MFKNGVIGRRTGNDIVLPRHLKWSDLIQSKRNNASKSSGSIIQHGVAELNVPACWLKVLFKSLFQNNSKQFLLVCSFGGYGLHLVRAGQSSNSSWGGCAFSAGVTNTSFTARCRRLMALSFLGTYYVNWIRDWLSLNYKRFLQFKPPRSYRRRFPVVWYFELFNGFFHLTY